MLQSEQHENTDVLPIMAQIMDSIKQFNKILSKMYCRGQYSILNKGEQHQCLAHEQHLPGESNKFSYYTCIYERGWSFIARS